MDTSFKGAAARLTDIDIPRIASSIGVGEDELHAFMDVEAAGSGFDSEGRVKMLFEPHVFWRLLGKGGKRDAAVRAGLAYQKWGAKPYPRESYTRLEKAMAIDETAALKASSWGLTQILGENHLAAGFPSVQAMVAAFMESEAAHLDATVKLITAWKLDDDLRRLAALKRPTKASDCAGIAETWNGKGYAKHNYHGRIAAAHNRWRKIKDTPYVVEKPKRPSAPRNAPAEDAFASVSMVRVVQERLTELGYPLGSRDPETNQFDGIVGTLTATAIRAFRADNGLAPGEGIDAALVAALDTATPRKLAPARENAETKTVAQKAPEVAANWRTEIVAKYGAAGAFVLALIDWVSKQFEAGRETLQPLLDIAGRVPGWAWLFLVVIMLVALWLHARRGREVGVEAFRSGARL